MDYEALFSVKGKHVLVTGGTGGLGRAIAECYLQGGAHVAVCSRKAEADPELEELAAKMGTRFLCIACDVTKPESVGRMMDQIGEAFGALEVLVNSAGMNKLLLAENYDDETFSTVMNLNLNGLHTVTREAGKRFMIPQNYGRIINLSSVKSIIGTTENYIAYCASKGAVNMYTKQLACEWGKYHITCNAIAPTFVRTQINAFQLDDPVFYQKLVDRIPLRRIGQLQDVAAAARYLGSDAAAFVNGQVLCVDGGLTAMQ